MGPFSGPVLIFALCLCLRTSFAYTEAVGANLNSGDAEFTPQVAFMCKKPAMHRSVNGWEPDFTTDCIKDADDILKYCKKVYPNHDIRNVMQMGSSVEIPAWPRFDSPDNNGVHEVHPFKCQVGEFESEALLVPQHCEFDHKHNSSRCENPGNWAKTAEEECGKHQMKLRSSSMLVECGTNAFRGVEYVCCPPGGKEEKPKPPTEEETRDDYSAYLRGDDMNQYPNEHKKFKAAEKAMMKRQHDKNTLMMKEWQEAREHVHELRKTDKKGADQLNKEITERFERMYPAYELEGLQEKKQLVALHQQRVQAIYNKKKNMLMRNYTAELERPEPRASKVFSFLKQYIRTEEKDRLHTVNHYEHLRDTDPKEAHKIRENVVKHLSLITQRIEDTIGKLDRDPELAQKIKPEIAEFRHKKFRNIDIGAEEVMVKPVDKKPVVDTVIEHTELVGKQEKLPQAVDVNHDYTNIQIDSEGMEEEDTPLVAHAQSNGMHVEQASFVEKQSVKYTATNVVGIAIGSVAVFIIIVVAVVMLRKRSRRQPITHGFVEVDPAASPEERHVANMQMNGYENPTYRYFEMTK